MENLSRKDALICRNVHDCQAVDYSTQFLLKSMTLLFDSAYTFIMTRWDFDEQNFDDLARRL